MYLAKTWEFSPALIRRSRIKQLVTRVVEISIMQMYSTMEIEMPNSEKPDYLIANSIGS